MANEVSYTAASVRHIGSPEDIIRTTATGAMYLGQPVYIDGSGEAVLAVASSVAAANMVGIIVYIGSQGATVAADGDMIGIAIGGRVEGYASMAPGNVIWVSSDSAGRLSTVVGTKSCVAGIALSATCLLVRPSLHIVTP